MASDRQIAANRRNAQLSTGPRTEVGKANSCRSAMTHGLTSQRLLMDGEDPEQFEAYRAELFGELQPTTLYEQELVERIVSLMWRLRRVPAFAAAVFTWVAYRQDEIHDSDHSANVNPSEGNSSYGNHRGLRRTDTQHNPEERAQLKQGRMLEAALKLDLTGKLNRHEAHLMRQLKETRNELAKSQARRGQSALRFFESAAPLPPSVTSETTAHSAEVGPADVEIVDFH
jgi:hypothetical protein